MMRVSSCMIASRNKHLLVKCASHGMLVPVCSSMMHQMSVGYSLIPFHQSVRQACNCGLAAPKFVEVPCGDTLRSGAFCDAHVERGMQQACAVYRHMLFCRASLRPCYCVRMHVCVRCVEFCGCLRSFADCLRSFVRESCGILRICC